MKKAIVILAIFGSTAVFAASSYLYWNADVAENGYNGEAWTASLKWRNGDDVETLANYFGDGTSVSGDLGKDVLGEYNSFGVGLYADITDIEYGTGSFYVEISSDWGTFTSQSLGYASAASYIAQNGVGTPASSVWSPSIEMSVPEPAGGLLMMLGLAGLALRRRRA